MIRHKCDKCYKCDKCDSSHDEGERERERERVTTNWPMIWRPLGKPRAVKPKGTYIIYI